MKRLTTTLLLLIAIGANAQSGGYIYDLTKDKTGAKMTFSGNGHQFSVVFKGEIGSPKLAYTPESNQYFITVDDKIITASLISVPAQLLKDKDVSHLGIDYETSLLSGYVNYEFDYFVNELKIDVKSISTKNFTENGHAYVLWFFPMKKNDDMDESAIAQVFLSTICFDQILSFSMPVLSPSTVSEAIDRFKSLSKAIEHR